MLQNAPLQKWLLHYQKLKNGKKVKLKKQKKTDMLRSIGKQSGESVESVAKKYVWAYKSAQSATQSRRCLLCLGLDDDLTN